MTQLHSNITWIAESPSTASPGWNFCPDCESEGALYCHRQRVHGPDRRKSTASPGWNFCPDCESEGALYCHRQRVHGPDRRKSTASSDWNFLHIILDLFLILFELLLGED